MRFFLVTGVLLIFHTPEFAFAKSMNSGLWSNQTAVEVRIPNSICVGEKCTFEALDPNKKTDSILWMFMDEFGKPQIRNQYKFDCVFTGTFTGKMKLVLWKGGFADTLFYPLSVGTVEKPDLGTDIELCKGDSIWIGDDKSGIKWKWNTGDSGSHILVKNRGNYVLTAVQNGCKKSDTVSIAWYGSVLSALGNEYFLCRNEGDLLELGAGEGFVRYRWSPVGDTIHWIIVDRTGNNFVWVQDYHGCKSESGTVINEQCDMKLWFPSSFTPNGDGLNDVFSAKGENIISIEIQIFNRWGEEVFHATGVDAAWDGDYLGNRAAGGAYVWKARATGFLNHKKVINVYSGTVELFR